MREQVEEVGSFHKITSRETLCDLGRRSLKLSETELVYSAALWDKVQLRNGGTGKLWEYVYSSRRVCRGLTGLVWVF